MTNLGRDFTAKLYVAHIQRQSTLCFYFQS